MSLVLQYSWFVLCHTGSFLYVMNEIEINLGLLKGWIERLCHVKWNHKKGSYSNLQYADTRDKACTLKAKKKGIFNTLLFIILMAENVIQLFRVDSKSFFFPIGSRQRVGFIVLIFALFLFQLMVYFCIIIGWMCVFCTSSFEQRGDWHWKAWKLKTTHHGWSGSDLTASHL